MPRSRKIFRPPCVEFWGRVLFQKARCIDGADVVRASEAGAPSRKRKQSRQRAKGPNPGRALSLLLTCPSPRGSLLSGCAHGRVGEGFTE